MPGNAAVAMYYSLINFTVLLAKSDSDFMFCLQSYLIYDR